MHKENKFDCSLGVRKWDTCWRCWPSSAEDGWMYGHEDHFCCFGAFLAARRGRKYWEVILDCRELYTSQNRRARRSSLSSVWRMVAVIMEFPWGSGAVSFFVWGADTMMVGWGPFCWRYLFNGKNTFTYLYSDGNGEDDNGEEDDNDSGCGDASEGGVLGRSLAARGWLGAWGEPYLMTWSWRWPLNEVVVGGPRRRVHLRWLILRVQSQFFLCVGVRVESESECLELEEYRARRVES